MPSPLHPGTANPQLNSIVEDAGRLVNRLLEFRERIGGIHDRLYGARVQPIGPGTPGASDRPPAPSNIINNLTNAHNVASDISDLLTHIESGL